MKCFSKVFKNKKWFSVRAEMITTRRSFYFALTIILCKSVIACDIFIYKCVYLVVVHWSVKCMGPQSSHDVYGWSAINNSTESILNSKSERKRCEHSFEWWRRRRCTRAAQQNSQMHALFRSFFFSFIGCKSMHFPPRRPKFFLYQLLLLLLLVSMVFIWSKNLWTTFPKIQHTLITVQCVCASAWWHWFLKLANREMR